jgi:hypothetical protein
VAAQPNVPSAPPAVPSTGSAPTPPPDDSLADADDASDPDAWLDADAQADPNPGPTSLPASLVGVVAPNSHAGHPLVQTSVGLLALDTDIALPAGTRITLAPTTDATTGSAFSYRPDAAGMVQPTLFAEAAAILPEIARVAANDQSASHWMAALLGLTAMADMGSVRAWLGEQRVSQLEEAGKKRQLDHLDRQTSQLKTPVRMPLPGDWQSLLLPMPLPDRVERIRLVVRRPPEDEQEAQARDEEGTRFLLDLTMSNLGPMQLDGLVRRKSKRFDLILRSHGALPGAAQGDIAAIFTKTLDGFGLKGRATFQQTTKFIEPIPMDGSAGMIFA